MGWRYSGITLLVLLGTLAARVPSLLPHSEPIPSEWLIPPLYDDPESRLAMGERLPLACADISSLELIKGISDTLAFELLAKRYDIMRAAVDTDDRNAIQKAHGVGAKTAEHLVRYLDLTTRCTVSTRYDVWRRE